MAYQNTIPGPNDFLTDSQVDLQNNFISLQASWIINHVNFDIANTGKHPRIDFPVQAPAPVFGVAGENGLYNFLNATTTKNELYVHKQTQAGTADIPFTASFLSDTVPTNNQDGWTYLPSGVLLRWGSRQVGGAPIGGGIITVTDAGLPAFNNLSTVFIEPNCPGVTDANFAVSFIDILNVTQFRVYCSNRTTPNAYTGATAVFIRYLMIGR